MSKRVLLIAHLNQKTEKNIKYLHHKINTNELKCNNFYHFKKYSK